MIIPSTRARKFKETQHPEDSPFISYVVRSKHCGVLTINQKISVLKNRSLIFHGVVSITYQSSHKDWI